MPSSTFSKNTVTPSLFKRLDEAIIVEAAMDDCSE